MMHVSSSVRRWQWAAATLAFGLAGVCPAAHATLQFSDNFLYDTGSLNGQGPPAGAPAGQTAWTTTSGNTQVTAGSLTYPGVGSSGNKATISGVSGNNGDISTAGMSQVGGGISTEWAGFPFR